MCQPDAELKNPTGTYRSAEGIRAAFKPFVDATSEREVQITNLVEAGDTLIVEFIARAKHHGTAPEPAGTDSAYAASGEPVRNRHLRAT